MQTFKMQQFVDRFNFTEPIVVPGEKISRAFNLSCLLNRHDTAFVNDSSTKNFIAQVGKDTVNYILSKDEKDWIVYAKCRFTYKNEPLFLTLKMNYIGDEQVGYKWVISKINGKIFDENISESKSSINPVNNEIGFSELSKALLAKEDMMKYSNDESYSSMSSFRDYIKNGDIVFNQINSIQYVFENIGDWNITVDYYMRKTMNAGWLISAIDKVKK
ncbi:MAG: hypothetical protein M9887_01990 [Chitinophagales bacterium]|nr:hypothetical protein [Chitinophagales bacterium]